MNLLRGRTEGLGPRLHKCTCTVYIREREMGGEVEEEGRVGREELLLLPILSSLP